MKSYLEINKMIKLEMETNEKPTCIICNQKSTFVFLSPAFWRCEDAIHALFLSAVVSGEES